MEHAYCTMPLLYICIVCMRLPHYTVLLSATICCSCCLWLLSWAVPNGRSAIFFALPSREPLACDAHNLGVEFEKQLRFRSHFVIMEYDSRIKVS